MEAGPPPGEKWLETLRPQEAIISVWQENRFGHPAPEVVDRLKVHGSAFGGHDRHGAMILRNPSARGESGADDSPAQGCRREKSGYNKLEIWTTGKGIYPS